MISSDLVVEFAKFLWEGVLTVKGSLRQHVSQINVQFPHTFSFYHSHCFGKKCSDDVKLLC